MPSKINVAGTGTQSLDGSAQQSPFYTSKFFSTLQSQNRIAALRVVLKVLEWMQPTSVIDVGCGTGEFLAAFREYGAQEILGIDGEYVQRSMLAIPQEDFKPYDLSRPFTFDRTYDLAVCLEVAEHLEPQSASGFIASLTRLAPIVLFSAAIPYQGGISHLNEQWPEYWADLFKQHDFVPVDAIRRSIWFDREIPFWYRQNILFFCSEEMLDRNEKLAQVHKITSSDALSIVHPDVYLACNTKDLRILRRVIDSMLPLWRFKEKIRKGLGKWKNSF